MNSNSTLSSARLMFAIWVSFAIVVTGIAWTTASGRGVFAQAGADESTLISLGLNSNRKISESSGLAISSHVADAVWTHNDSGNSDDLFLLKTDGELLAQVRLKKAKNVDWEAMSRFEAEGKSWLLVADVGDNAKRRERYQFYLLTEPDLADELAETKPKKLPVELAVKSTRIEFRYEDGPRNCEAMGVDATGKNIWLVEKISYGAARSEVPGVYILPLTLTENKKPLVARRIANFPIRNVTGMAFSPDGKRLIIRNYVDAHMYRRPDGETWERVVRGTRPVTVVLPIQRQGEAVCFTADSKSVIITSEFRRQTIWQVNVEQYFAPRRLQRAASSGRLSPEEEPSAKK